MENGRFHWHVTVPANASAEVHVPADNVETVTERGRSAAQAPGVTFLRAEPARRTSGGIGRAIFEVGSGKYEFQSALE
ncbi:MAG: alpha-L-rhamnosidase C-terminal domain-containing protein [Planctomycetota bacterium]